ncbi:MAG: hypothetical protein AB7R89_09985 [Dehalococcoidia bacterium]
MLRIALGFLVAPAVLMIALLAAVVHRDAMHAADYGARLPQWPQLALVENCEPASVLLSIDDVPDGFILERDQDFLTFESTLRQTFRGTLPQRDPQSNIELIVEVAVLPSAEEAGDHMQGIRDVLDLLEQRYTRWDGLIGEETLVIRTFEEVADGPARERIDVHFQVGRTIGSMFWEDDAGWSDLDDILQIARILEARMVACNFTS